MTGQEHYIAAQELINSITKPDSMNPSKRVLQPGDHADVIALAQVHATMAATIATVQSAGVYMTNENRDAWQQAARSKLAQEAAR